MVMTSCGAGMGVGMGVGMGMGAGMGEARDHLPALWRRIEDAHYSYLETEDSPEKLIQKNKLDGYIKEYLSMVPHEMKFGLPETTRVFARTVEQAEFSAYRAGQGWAALARYAANLLAQPWRKEYRTIRLYCGYFKHEVEACLAGAEGLLRVLGYRAAGAGRLHLAAALCPDTVCAVSRDALIAATECQIMCEMWEQWCCSGSRASWRDVARARQMGAGPRTDSELYSNIPAPVLEVNQRCRVEEPIYHNHEPIEPIIQPHYMIPPALPPALAPALPPTICPYQDVPVSLPHCSTLVMNPYLPYYYPMQPQYMVPVTYAPIRHQHSTNGYGSVPTAQLIELETPAIYENRSHVERQRRKLDSKRCSTSKSGFSDVSLPSLPRSDTQPALSKAREDGMGTYESWDYVFRNLSNKDEQDIDAGSPYSSSLDRDSRTLDRLERKERKMKYQPTTLDLEDGLRALNLERSYDETGVARSSKVNENLMRLKQEQERKRAKLLEEKRVKRPVLEPIPNPPADALVANKVAPDKVRLLSKKDSKDRKDIIKKQNGAIPNVAEARKMKKPSKHLLQDDKPVKSKSLENGHSSGSSTKNATTAYNQTDYSQPNYDLKAQLIVTLDEPDSRSPPRQVNGERERSQSRASDRERPKEQHRTSDKWECGTCTYLNKGSVQACDMCGKSKKGPEIEPLTSGGRECPACTLVNQREARTCDACGTSLQHCPTYI